MLFFKCIGMAIGLLFLFLFAESVGKKKQDNNRPVAAEHQCPICGTVNKIFYVPAQEKKPALFRCSDCMRYYGSKFELSPEELKIVLKSDDDCRRVLQSPGLDGLVDAVVSFFENYNSRSSDLSMITFKDGKVTVCSSGKLSSRIIATYYNISVIADQHICLLCYGQLKSQMPYRTFTFGDRWVSMEVFKHNN